MKKVYLTLTLIQKYNEDNNSMYDKTKTFVHSTKEL